MYVIGIDIGGSKVASAIVEKSGRVLFFSKDWVKSKVFPEELLELVLKVISKKIKQAKDKKLKIVGIGIGSPGPLDVKKGIIVDTPNLPWRNLPLKDLIKKEFSLPMFLDNDANCALLGEVWLGAAKNCKDAIMLTLGTGIGGALMKNSKIVHTEKGSAELGHVIIDPNGPVGNCGQRGCIESLISGVALEKQTGISTYNLFDKIEKGNKKYLKIIGKAAGYLNLALEKFDREFKLERIILGGGMIKAKPYQKFLFDYLPSDLKPKVKIATLGEKAGVLGAARLVFQNGRVQPFTKG